MCRWGEGATMAHDMEETVIEVVKLIRSQNWKRGGALSVDSDESEAVVLQLVQTAYSKGQSDATKLTGERMLRIFDEAAARITGGRRP